MTITAKFSTICPCCSKSIAPGSKVEWTKGSPARHVTCKAPAVDARPYTGWGRDGRATQPASPARMAAYRAELAAQVTAGPIGTYAAVASQWGEADES